MVRVRVRLWLRLRVRLRDRLGLRLRLQPKQPKVLGLRAALSPPVFEAALRFAVRVRGGGMLVSLLCVGEAC